MYNKLVYSFNTLTSQTFCFVTVILFQYFPVIEAGLFRIVQSLTCPPRLIGSKSLNGTYFGIWQLSPCVIRFFKGIQGFNKISLFILSQPQPVVNLFL